MRKNLLWILLMTLIIFSLFSGNMIEITVAQVDHDIAVVSVTPYPTKVGLGLGELVNVTVIIENQGTENENFTVTVYYGNETIQTTIIETQNVVNQAPNTNKTLTFTWDTTNTREEIYATEKKEKTYTINATVTIALDEDPDDNTGVSQVTVISQYIAVRPQSTVDPTLTSGKNYTVSIYTDYNGSDVWGYQFALSYNPNILEGIEVVNGDLITEDKDPSARFILGTFNETLGATTLTQAYFYYIPPTEPYVTSGPGTLANVTFQVKDTGDSNITITEVKRGTSITKLLGLNYAIINDYSPYFGHLLPGYFSNTEEPVTHDIAVVSVTPSPTSVEEGELVNITVVVVNQGTVAEIFDVKVYINYEPGFPGEGIIGRKTAQSLAAGAETSLTFTWDTDGKGGTYTITAVASTVGGETDTEDNMHQSVEMVAVNVPEEQPLPITELIIGIVVVVIVIAVVRYTLKRRKKPSEQVSNIHFTFFAI